VLNPGNFTGNPWGLRRAFRGREYPTLRARTAPGQGISTRGYPRDPEAAHPALAYSPPNRPLGRTDASFSCS